MLLATEPPSLPEAWHCFHICLFEDRFASEFCLELAFRGPLGAPTQSSPAESCSEHNTGPLQTGLRRVRGLYTGPCDLCPLSFPTGSMCPQAGVIFNGARAAPMEGTLKYVLSQTPGVQRRPLSQPRSLGRACFQKELTSEQGLDKK